MGGAGKILEHRPGKIYFCLCNATIYTLTQRRRSHLETTNLNHRKETKRTKPFRISRVRALGTSSWLPSRETIVFSLRICDDAFCILPNAALGIRGGLFFSLVKVRVADFGSILVARVGRD